MSQSESALQNAGCWPNQAIAVRYAVSAIPSPARPTSQLSSRWVRRAGVAGGSTDGAGAGRGLWAREPAPDRFLFFARTRAGPAKL